jgi:hypothetical protein
LSAIDNFQSSNESLVSFEPAIVAPYPRQQERGRAGKPSDYFLSHFISG